MKFTRLKLLTTLLKNRNENKMNRDLIGFTTEELVSTIKEKHLRKYKIATGDKSTDKDFPLFFICRIFFPSIVKILTDKRLRLNLLRMVHGSQHIEISGKIKRDNITRAVTTISDIEDSPVGEILTLKSELFSDDNILLISTAKFIVRAKKKTNLKVAKTSENIAIKRPVSEDLYKELPVIYTEKNQARKYARASADKNLIHTSRLFAKLAGLKRPILQGLCLMAMVYNSLLKEILQNRVEDFKGISLRFSTPVFPGQRLRLITWPADDSSLCFEVKNSRGKIVLKNGIFRYNSDNSL